MTQSLLVSLAMGVAREIQNFGWKGLSHVTTPGAGVDSIPPKTHLKRICWGYFSKLAEYFPKENCNIIKIIEKGKGILGTKNSISIIVI